MINRSSISKNLKYFFVKFVGEGCSLPTEDFIEMFKKVASIKGLEDNKIKEVMEYLEAAGAKQDGILSHENFKTDLCPPLS